jgi:ActR/RegA family two-component response regulator
VDKRILIVDNDEAIARALVRRLTTRGYAAHAVTDTDRGLAAFQEDSPELLIVGLTLPNESAGRLCRSVRARPRGALVPILMLGTGDETIRTPGEAIAAGADHYFRKPEGIDGLLDKIATFIGPGRREAVASAPPATRPPVHSAPVERAPVAHAPSWAPAEAAYEPEGYAPPHGADGAPPPVLGDTPGRGFAEAQDPEPDPRSVYIDVIQPGRGVALERRGVSEILSATAQVRLTGRVEVAAGGVLRRVFLDHGRPVYADSSADGEDLAAWLAAEGYVARNALARARARAAQIGGTPEEILMETGYLKPDDVYRALHGHVVDRVLALFALEAGETVVIQGGPRPLDPVDLGMHPGRLVLDGVRRKYGRLRLYRAYGTPTSVPRARSEISRDGLVLRTDEESVLASCDGVRTALEVARTARVGEVDCLAILYALSVLGFVDPPQGRPRAGALPPLAESELIRAGAPRTADDLPGFSDLVGSKLTEVQSADYFHVLGVPRTASSAELRAAWETLRRRFDPHRVRRDGPLWHPVMEIAAVVEDAWRMLSDTRLRARYEQALS